jgi:RNA polymerase sigma factor (sigma-70 family)
MAIERRGALDGQLRTLWTAGVVGDDDDRTLLSRYALSQDEAAEVAFRVLVERHGPMVLRICRQLTGDLQAAEDATQAVFLLLSRRAGQIRVGDTVAPWLHGVARRVAAKARARAAARRRSEAQAARVAASLRDGAARPEIEDWEMIHQEVDRLPEKYRTPVVLCYLEGRTYEQAARWIGCPVGTVRVRLSRARERLQIRLRRRGFGPERTAVGGWFGHAPRWGLPTAPSALGESVTLGEVLLEAIVKVVRAQSAGRQAMAGIASPLVLELYESGVRAMMINRWMAAAAVLLAAGLTGAGAIGFAAIGSPGQNPAAISHSQPRAIDTPRRKAAQEPPIDLDSPATLRKQMERRTNAARQRLDAQRAYYEEGRITIGRFIDASRQLMLAEAAVSSSKQQRLAAVKAHWDRMAEVQKREQAELDRGKGTVADLAEANVAHENAAYEYIAARQSAGSTEVEDLTRRVEALERESQPDLDSPERLRKQIERRLAAARHRLEAQRALYREGRITIDRYIDASEQLRLAEIAASATKDQRVAAAKAHLDRIGDVVKLEQDELEKGRGTVADVAEAMVAQENAACVYLEARQDRGSRDVEILRRRIEALEKHIDSHTKHPAQPKADIE